jgi:hypothetical protein
MLKKNVATGFKTTMVEARIGALIWDAILINAPPRCQLRTVGVGVVQVQSSSIHGAAELTDGEGAGTMVIGGAATTNGEEETFRNVPDGKVLPFHQHYRPH